VRRRPISFGLSAAVAVALALPGAASAAPLVTYYELPRALRNADHIAPGPDGALWLTQDTTQQTRALGRITTSGEVSRSRRRRAP